MPMIEDLENRGEVLIMRGLAGVFKDAPLPRLGKANIHGLKINDQTGAPGQRFRTVWWDDLRERGRAEKRVDDGASVMLMNVLSVLIPSFITEFIFAWDEAEIAETDDIVKLLERGELGESPKKSKLINPIENLGASSTMPAAPKITTSAQKKKKAQRRRPLKITNTHMKAQVSVLASSTTSTG